MCIYIYMYIYVFMYLLFIYSCVYLFVHLLIYYDLFILYDPTNVLGMGKMIQRCSSEFQDPNIELLYHIK